MFTKSLAARWDGSVSHSQHSTRLFVFVFRVCVLWDVKKNIKTCKRRRWRSVEKFQKSLKGGGFVHNLSHKLNSWKNPSNRLIFSTKCYSLNNNKMGWSSLIFSLSRTHKNFRFHFPKTLEEKKFPHIALKKKISRFFRQLATHARTARGWRNKKSLKREAVNVEK